MDFRPTPAQATLRHEVRDFLAQDPAVSKRLGARSEPQASVVSPRRFPEDGWITGFDPAFSRRLGARGWIGLTWPRAYGGSERSYLERLIVTEELLLAGAPVAAHWFGDRQIGPALLAHGSPEQKAEILPRIARGELVVCIGMSEPGAGSDLAALSTRADVDGDAFVIRGQKTWTSFATQAHYCYLVARTDPQAPRHKGISELLVSMDTPGIEVRPIRDMVGEEHFAELFFNDVRVPRSTLIGTLHRGFYQIMQQLDYERSGIERLLSNHPLWRDALAWAREHGLLRDDPALAQEVAELETQRRCGRLLVYRVAALLSEGSVPNHEAALAKTYCTRVEQRMADLAVRILGPAALLREGPRAALGGRAARSLLYAPAYTIQGGTDNILRNIVARRGLGLPD